MDANSLRLSRLAWWETVCTLGVCTKQLFFFQVFVRETRTPAFISLQKDWERRVSAFSKNFCVKRTSVAKSHKSVRPTKRKLAKSKDHNIFSQLLTKIKPTHTQKS
jgi:hypothetical protein